MKPQRDTKPRICIELSTEQYRDLQDVLPWGTRRIVFSIFIDDLVAALRRDERILGAFMAREIKSKDLVKEIDL